VVCRYDHDKNMLLGTTDAGTLRVGTDSRGLEYEVDPPKARANILELVERGDIRSSSFAFRARRTGSGGRPVRTISRCAP
jgi:uncharacterized protein